MFDLDYHDERRITGEVMDLLADREQFEDVLRRMSSDGEDLVTLYKNFWNDPVSMYRDLNDESRRKFLRIVNIKLGLENAPDESDFCDDEDSDNA